MRSASSLWRGAIAPAMLTPFLLALILGVLVVLPMAWLLIYAMTDETGAFTLANLVYIVSNREFLRPFATTIGIAVGVTALSCFIAAPLAWAVTSTDMPFPRLIRILTIASFVTPPFLGAISWEILAAPNSGVLNNLIRDLLGLAPDAAVFDIYSTAGVVFVMTCYAFPYVFVVLSNALETIPSELEDASAIFGAGRWRTTARILLPIVMPALLSGAVISFIQAMTQFGVPAILALPANILVTTTLLASFFQYPPQLHLAAASSLPVLALTMLLLWLRRRVLGRRGYAVIAGKAGARRRLALGAWRWPIFAMAFLLLAAVVLLPNLIVLKMSLSRTLSDLFAPGNTTLAQFRYVFFDVPQIPLVLRNTLAAGIVAASFGTILAVAVGYMTARRTGRLIPVLGWLATAPIAIPGIVLGVALFLSYTRPPFQLYGSLWIILIAFVTIELPAAYQMIQAAFQGLHQELEEASRIFGATPLRSMIGITLPLLGPSVVAAWCFIFIGSVRELSAAVLLASADTKLVSVLIFDFNQSANYGAIAVLGVTIMLLTLAVVTVANSLRHLGKSAPRIL